MKKEILVAISVAGVLFGLSVSLAAQEKLSLAQCREMALKYNKDMAAANKQTEAARLMSLSYKANFFPNFTANGTGIYSTADGSLGVPGGNLPVFLPNPATGELVSSGFAYFPGLNLDYKVGTVYSGGVQVEQPLYMGGKVRSAFRMASIGKEIADLNVKYNQAEVLAEADAAYWQYLKVCEQVKAAGKYLEVVKELVRNLEDAYRTGMAAQNDLLKAQVKQNEAELMVQKAQNGLALSGMNLCRIVGVDLMSELTVRDSLGEGIVSGLWEEGDNITGRPEYNMLERQIELKEKEVALTRSDFLPQLGVSASYGYSDGITLNGKSDGIASFAALASLKIPIYHWGEGRNKVKAMKAEEEMVRLKKEETEQMMQLEVARARYNVEDAATRVRLTRRSLSQAEENLQVSKNRFEVGMETLTNYMEAQAQWQKAWSDWIEAKAELRVNETYYLKSTGRLSD